MSHSNSKKSRLSLLIFSLIFFIITGIMIYLIDEEFITFSPKEEIESPKTKVESDNLGIKSLSSTYQKNAIELEVEAYHYGKKLEYDNYQIEVYYPKINGLKDSHIQDKINKDIKDKAMSLFSKDELKNKDVENIIVTYSCEANFSNVLSILLEKDVILKTSYNTDKESHIYVGLNYNLKTGEKIKFSDLFTNDAGTKNIIQQSAYMSFANEYLYYYDPNDDDWVGDMSEIDYSAIEDRVFKVMQKYDRNSNYNFYFNTRYIWVSIEDEDIEIEMRKFYPQIAIYNRFINYKDLYTKEKNNNYPVFSLEYSDEYYVYRRLEEISDNFFIDVNLGDFTDIEDKENNNYEKYIAEIELKIEECQEYLNKNKDKAIVLAISKELYNDYDNPDNQIEDQFFAQATMEKDYYQNTFKSLVLESEQTDQHKAEIFGNCLFDFLYYNNKNNSNIDLIIMAPEGYI